MFGIKRKFIAGKKESLHVVSAGVWAKVRFGTYAHEETMEKQKRMAKVEIFNSRGKYEIIHFAPNRFYVYLNEDPLAIACFGTQERAKEWIGGGANRFQLLESEER